MKRWLVTCHDQYYPRTGTSDWREVFADEDHQKALDYARWLETEYGECSTYVIDMWKWIDYKQDKPRWQES